MKYFFVVSTFFVFMYSFAQAQQLNVAAIFRNKCASCHKPGEAAPFSLQTYDDVVKRKTLIKDVIQSGYMPPWKADTHYQDFLNNRSLTAQEKETIINWINTKTPKRAFNLTAIKNGQEKTAYPRSPDMTLKISKPYVVKGNNQERFVVFKIPYQINADKSVEAVEFFSNNKKIVHHINYGFYAVPDSGVNIYADDAYVDPETDGTKIHQYDKYYRRPMTYYTGWIPGSTYESYPPGIGWKLEKRGIVMLTVHYSALAADEESVVGVNLFFTSKPVERAVSIVSLGSQGFGEADITPPLLIEPNVVKTFTLDMKTTDDQSIMYVWPHMHYIGKEFTAYAITPAKDTIRLVHISEWDFRWQELYKFKKFVKVPAGSIIHMIGTYDNTAKNPFNPNSPPQTIYSTQNMKATDEMFTLIMIYVPYQSGDENRATE
ncbi:MAG: cytochrome c [Niabella sp.]|nr:cytochrome c [Niabella sp.]